MIIRDLYNKVLNEMDSGAATNNVGGSGADAVAMFDPILKIQSKLGKRIYKIRRPIDPTIRSTEGDTGPYRLPHNPISNNFDNGNKSNKQNPLKLLNKNPVPDALKRAVKKSDLRSRVYK